ncbi:hypothetical protein D3C76_1145510 [compost metagenome]
MLFDDDHHATHCLRDLCAGKGGLLAATEHQLVGLADTMAGLDYLSNDRVQVVNKAVDPAPHISSLVVGHTQGIQPLAQVALAFSDGSDHTSHLAQSCRQPFRPKGAEQDCGRQHAQHLASIDQTLLQTTVVLDQEIAGEQT